MRWVSLVVLAVAGSATAADDPRQLTVQLLRGLPPVEAVTVYQTKDGKRAAVGELAKFDKPFALPNDGPFEVWVKPKGGQAIRVIEKLMVKAGQTHEMKIGDVMGAIEVFGDEFPRADKIVITDVRDPGPGEKGHVAVQWGKEYRVELAVPPGTYAVWVVPANGAKAQRVVENVRVTAGKSIRVGD
jgi:hypothetical protein